MYDALAAFFLVRFWITFTSLYVSIALFLVALFLE